jgi:hypothetical protein
MKHLLRAFSWYKSELSVVIRTIIVSILVNQNMAKFREKLKLQHVLTGLKITDPGRNHFIFMAYKSEFVGLQVLPNSNIVMSMAVIRE